MSDKKSLMIVSIVAIVALTGLVMTSMNLSKTYTTNKNFGGQAIRSYEEAPTIRDNIKPITPLEVKDWECDGGVLDGSEGSCCEEDGTCGPFISDCSHYESLCEAGEGDFSTE